MVQVSSPSQLELGTIVWESPSRLVGNMGESLELGLQQHMEESVMKREGNICVPSHDNASSGSCSPSSLIKDVSSFPLPFAYPDKGCAIVSIPVMIDRSKKHCTNRNREASNGYLFAVARTILRGGLESYGCCGTACISREIACNVSLYSSRKEGTDPNALFAFADVFAKAIKSCIRAACAKCCVLGPDQRDLRRRFR